MLHERIHVRELHAEGPTIEGLVFMVRDLLPRVESADELAGERNKAVGERPLENRGNVGDGGL